MGWKTYLIQQAQAHPAMRPQDVYKMIFQAAYGAEHLLMDESGARAYFDREFAQVAPTDGLLYEQIGDESYRVNLGAWKGKGLPAEWLFGMFVGSVSRQKAVVTQGQALECAGENVTKEQKRGRQCFEEYEKIAQIAAREGVFGFPYEELMEYAREYHRQGLRPVHHSEDYREAYKPAYRLVGGEYLRVLPILEWMANREKMDWESVTQEKIPLKEIRQQGSKECPWLIAIDGRCASGKSTMAQLLSEITGAGVVHMDDFFLPMELRSKERLAEPGGNVHYERYREEVLPFLRGEEAFSYRRFDCGKMQLGEERIVGAGRFRVIEGAYSLHPLFGDYADLKVFSHVDEALQLERICDRDGEEALAMFRERWIPMEERYFEAYGIQDKADLFL